MEHDLMPIEPPPSYWSFPSVDSANEYGVVGVGADLEPGTLLEAYRSGIFPMPLGPNGTIGWWSPDPRGILEPSELIMSRSLRRSCRRYEVRFNSDFEAILLGCANASRPNSWIDDRITAAYLRLHNLGWVHSVEAWDEEGLAGGLYGVALGGLFVGESMFYLRPDASKVALAALVNRYLDQTNRLIDVQWATTHLTRLGAKKVQRSDYLSLLTELLYEKGPIWEIVK